MSSIVGCNRLSASTNLKGHQVKQSIKTRVNTHGNAFFLLS
ncbi:hypothetical protein V6Z11_A10G115500 [Gossypium hirsutum]